MKNNRTWNWYNELHGMVHPAKS